MYILAALQYKNFVLWALDEAWHKPGCISKACGQRLAFSDLVSEGIFLKKKSTDQMHSYHAADLCPFLFFANAESRFSHYSTLWTANMIKMRK